MSKHKLRAVGLNFDLIRAYMAPDVAAISSIVVMPFPTPLSFATPTASIMEHSVRRVCRASSNGVIPCDPVASKKSITLSLHSKNCSLDMSSDIVGTSMSFLWSAGWIFHCPGLIPITGGGGPWNPCPASTPSIHEDGGASPPPAVSCTTLALDGELAMLPAIPACADAAVAVGRCCCCCCCPIS